MTTMHRRHVGVVLLLFLATAFLSLWMVLPVSAAETSLLVLSEETATYIPTDHLPKIDNFVSSMREWSGLSGSSVSFYGLTVMENAMRLLPGTSGIAGARRMLKTPLDTGDATELLISLLYSSDTDGTVTIVLETASGAFVSEGILPAGESTLLLVDLTPLKGKAITAYSISVENDSEAFESVRVFSIHTGRENRFRMADQYASPALSVKDAAAEWTDDGLRITPSENFSSLAAYSVIADHGKGFFQIQLTAEKSGMSLYFITNEGVRSSGIALREGKHTYLFALDTMESLTSYELTVSGAAGAAFSLHSVQFYFYDEPSADEEAIGSATACRLSGDAKTLTVSGKLSSSAVITYMEGSVAVFETDESGNFDKTKPLAVTDISTRFTFTLNAAELSLITGYYQLAIIAEDGTVIPFDEPRTAVGTEGIRENSSVLGLSGAAEADTFSANASHVIVDVFLDQLLSETAGGRLCSWNNAHYYLDSAYLERLDQEIRFYEATGIDIYLRFLSAADLSSLHLTLPSDDPQAIYYALDGTSPEGEKLLSAMTNFLTGRYTEIAGIVLGYQLDDSRLHAGNAETLLAFVDNYVRSARLIYHIAIRNGHTDILLYVPMGNRDGEDRENALLLTALLQNRFAKGGSIPVGLLFCTGSMDTVYEDKSFFYNRLKLAAAAPAIFTCLVTPTDTSSLAETLQLYEALCLRAKEAACSIVFLDARSISDHALYNALKALLIAEDRKVESFSPLSEKPSFSGSYALWDFINSYDALDWLAGGSFSQPLTTSSKLIAEHLSLSAARALISSMEGNAHGILLCTPSKKLDLSSSPYVTFTLLYTGDADTASLTLIFGSGDRYAEFPVTLVSGEVTDVICDLSAYSGITAVDFVGLEASENVGQLELARVVLSSMEMTDDDLKASFSDSESPLSEETPRDTSLLFGTVFLMFIGSIVIFLLISKRRS